MSEVYYTFGDIDGCPDFHHIRLDVVTVGAKLKITTQVTGYTLSHIYGQGSPNLGHRPKYREIVVPTYAVELYNSEGKKVNTFNLTRDSWYYRGFKDEKPDWDPRPPYDKCKLVNRHFNPRSNAENLYNLIAQEPYPRDSDLIGFSIKQYGDVVINAECHTSEQNTYLDGTEVEGARKNLCKAESVMIHIGGWYKNEGLNVTKLGGSEGCLGFIPTHQIFDESEAQEMLEKEKFKTWKTSNNEYKKFVAEVVETRGATKNSVRLVVEKRENVQIFKNADYV